MLFFIRLSYRTEKMETNLYYFKVFIPIFMGMSVLINSQNIIVLFPYEW